MFPYPASAALTMEESSCSTAIKSSTMLIPTLILEKLEAVTSCNIQKPIGDLSAKIRAQLAIFPEQMASIQFDAILGFVAKVLTILLWLSFSYFGLTKVILCFSGSDAAKKASERWITVLRVDRIGMSPSFLFFGVGLLELILAQLLLTHYLNIGAWGLLFIMANALYVCYSLGNPMRRAFIFFVMLLALSVTCNYLKMMQSINLEFMPLALIFGTK